MKRLVIASNNEGKLRELSAILSPLGFETVPQAALGVPEREPTTPSSRHARRRELRASHGLAALADDSAFVDPRRRPRRALRAFAGRHGTRASATARTMRSSSKGSRGMPTASHYVWYVLVRHGRRPLARHHRGQWHRDTRLRAEGVRHDPFLSTSGHARSWPPPRRPPGHRPSGCAVGRGCAAGIERRGRRMAFPRH